MPNRKEDALWTLPVIITLMVSVLCLIATSVGSYYQHEQVEIARQSASIPSQGNKTSGEFMKDIPLIVSGVSAVLAVLAFGVLIYITKKKLSGSGGRSSELRLKIHSALYGIQSINEKDVTEILRARGLNALAMRVGNITLECDPVPGQSKEIRVGYSYEGKYSTAIKRENDLLILPEDRADKDEIESMTIKLKALEDERAKAGVTSTSGLSFTPLHVEVLKLHRDLRELRKEAGPAPKPNLESLGPKKAEESISSWQARQIAASDEWMKPYGEWGRKLIYNYQRTLAERVKSLMHSLGAEKGMVVKPLEPFTNTIAVEDFDKLSDILLDYFIKLEGGSGVRQEVRLPQMAPEAPDVLTLSPYPLTLVKLAKYAPSHPSSTEVYRDKVQFVIKNSYDQQVEIWAPTWESTEVPAQIPLISRFIKEGMEGSAGASVEETVVRLDPTHEIQGWIGLRQPSGEGLEVRLSHQNTGYLVFLLRIGCTLRYAKVKI